MAKYTNEINGSRSVFHIQGGNTKCLRRDGYGIIVIEDTMRITDTLVGSYPSGDLNLAWNLDNTLVQSSTARTVRLPPNAQIILVCVARPNADSVATLNVYSRLA